jgi:Family of unknown function (DUF5686)/CarboxypepD_reg-like domain
VQKHRYLIYICLFAFPILLRSQHKTIVSGQITDAKSGEPLVYVSVQFTGGTIGVTSDNYGRFLLEKVGDATSVKISYIGYETQTIAIKSKERTDVTIKLVETAELLKEITIKPQKYSKKNNPAVDLVHQVFLHKDQNRKEGLPYYELDTHEKLRFDLNGVTDKYRKKWYFRRFQYAFSFCDTNPVNKRVKLPFFFRERLLTSYFRRNPFTKKDKLWAERQTTFDDDYTVDRRGISNYLNSMYSDIDVYEPTITLLDKQFIGPLSSAATAFYKFYITDTITIDSQRFASLFFAPHNKNDLAFMGTMLVALDSTYAVKSVDMGISKDINLNWVKEIKIKQDYTFMTDSNARRLLLRRDELVFDLTILKKSDGRSLLVTKKNAYQKYILNQPKPDTFYKGKVTLLRDTGKLERTPQYWEKNRIDSLTLVENNIKTMVDSIKSIKMVKALTYVGTIMASGYANLGLVQVGSLNGFLRFNGVEGTRYQLALRTNDRHFKTFRIRTYAGYGTKDKDWKYGISTSFALNGTRPGRYPLNQLTTAYERDLYVPGLGRSYDQTIINSVQTSANNRLLLHRIVKADYSREYLNGFSYTMGSTWKNISEAGIASEGQTIGKQTITTELSASIRFAPNEKFYQNNDDRVPIRTKFPVFSMQYRAGLKGILGGEYAYQRVSLRTDKTFYVAPFGKSRWSLESGAILGEVSYTLLEIHRANQSYFFMNQSFSLMNYLEFVSDRYAVLHVNHDFEGILLNRIPLIKKLHLRETFTFKALYGTLTEKNIPTATNGLLPFPTDANKRPLTQPLSKMPYLEVGAGIGNLFGFMRVDYIWRLTYKELPNVQKQGIKFTLNAGF